MADTNIYEEIKNFANSIMGKGVSLSDGWDTIQYPENFMPRYREAVQAATESGFAPWNKYTKQHSPLKIVEQAEKASERNKQSLLKDYDFTLTEEELNAGTIDIKNFKFDDPRDSLLLPKDKKEVFDKVLQKQKAQEEASKVAKTAEETPKTETPKPTEQPTTEGTPKAETPKPTEQPAAESAPKTETPKPTEQLSEQYNKILDREFEKTPISDTPISDELLKKQKAQAEASKSAETAVLNKKPVTAAEQTTSKTINRREILNSSYQKRVGKLNTDYEKAARDLKQGEKGFGIYGNDGSFTSEADLKAGFAKRAEAIEGKYQRAMFGNSIKGIEQEISTITHGKAAFKAGEGIVTNGSYSASTLGDITDSLTKLESNKGFGKELVEGMKDKGWTASSIAKMSEEETSQVADYISNFAKESSAKQFAETAGQKEMMKFKGIVGAEKKAASDVAKGMSGLGIGGVAKYALGATLIYGAYAAFNNKGQQSNAQLYGQQPNY